MKTTTKSTKTCTCNINKGRTFWLHGIHQNTTNLGLGNDKEVKKPNIPNQPKQKRRPNTTNLVDMPKGLTFCIVVLQKLKNKTKTYSLIDMHHQKDLNRYTPIFKPQHTVQPKLNRKNKNEEENLIKNAHAS